MDSGAYAKKSGASKCLYSGKGAAIGSGASSPSQHDPDRSASFKRRSRCELAGRKCSGVFRFPTRAAAMIRIDSIWLATESVDMGAGTETAVAIQALIKSPVEHFVNEPGC